MEACVRNKTDYVDVTGESLFIKDIIAKYHDQAVKNNVLIVPSTGFDSMPFDLGVFAIADRFAEKGQRVGQVRSHLLAAKGGFSGGTIATLTMLAALPKSRLETIADPYCLCDSSSTRLSMHLLSF